MPFPWVFCKVKFASPCNVQIFNMPEKPVSAHFYLKCAFLCPFSSVFTPFTPLFSLILPFCIATFPTCGFRQTLRLVLPLLMKSRQVSLTQRSPLRADTKSPAGRCRKSNPKSSGRTCRLYRPVCRAYFGSRRSPAPGESWIIIHSPSTYVFSRLGIRGSSSYERG